jgi:hypothetical protein
MSVRYAQKIIVIWGAHPIFRGINASINVSKHPERNVSAWADFCGVAKGATWSCFFD